jgi:hypothetical protein
MAKEAAINSDPLKPLPSQSTEGAEPVDGAEQLVDKEGLHYRANGADADCPTLATGRAGEGDDSDVGLTLAQSGGEIIAFHHRHEAV